MTYTQQPAGSGNLIVTLRVLAGPAAGSELRVSGELLLGREADGAGRLGSDPALSRRHAVLTVSPSGIVTIEDLGSTNGTRVNDVRVTGKQVLRVGDKVRLGESVLQLGGGSGGDATRLLADTAAAGGPAAQPPSLERARALLDANDYAGSLAEYERLIAEGRDLAAACQGAGYILFLSGQLVQADALFGRSLAVNPANANALYLRGQIADKQGNSAAAQDWYRQALAVNPQHPSARAALKPTAAPADSSRPAGSSRPADSQPPPARERERYEPFGDMADTLGIYEYLTRDDSPLSRQTVDLIDQLTVSARPHVIAYAGRRSQQKLARKLKVLRAMLILLWIFALLLQVASIRKAVGGPVGLHSQVLVAVAVLTVLFAVIPSLLYLLFAATTRYTIARGRLQIESGLLSRNIKTVELWRVARMELHRSMLNRVTRDGTLVITIRDEQNPLLVTGMKRGQELEALRQRLMNLVFALRSNPMVKGIIQ